MGLGGETSDGIAGDGGAEDIFSKMGPECEIWSHFADFGPILFLKGEMLKPINWENGVLGPTADPPLSHC